MFVRQRLSCTRLGSFGVAVHESRGESESYDKTLSVFVGLCRRCFDHDYWCAFTVAKGTCRYLANSCLHFLL